MRKVYNFSAGPGMLPEEVLKIAQAEMLDWHDTGMSIMELGHRGIEFTQLTESIETNLRELMNIPKNYHVLFIPGGASAQFAMVPLNLLQNSKKADYIDTGIWSKKAIEEARRYGEINIAASVKKSDTHTYIPLQEKWHCQSHADYLHYTPNETIEGIEFNWIPEHEVPIVADMSSMILSRPIDVTKYGLIYAGAQKNMGQAGITLVIVHEKLIKEPKFLTPTLYQYKTHVEHHSFYNTPPTYSWYITGLVLQWLKEQGGVEALYKKNLRKAAKLYSCIDHHKDFYINCIRPDCRSIMNIIFNLKNDELTQKFITEATEARLTNLSGHRKVGGIRASIYNSMPEEGVDALIHFMNDFANKY